MRKGQSPRRRRSAPVRERFFELLFKPDAVYRGRRPRTEPLSHKAAKDESRQAICLKPVLYQKHHTVIIFILGQLIRRFSRGDVLCAVHLINRGLLYRAFSDKSAVSSAVLSKPLSDSLLKNITDFLPVEISHPHISSAAEENSFYPFQKREKRRCNSADNVRVVYCGFKNEDKEQNDYGKEAAYYKENHREFNGAAARRRPETSLFKTFSLKVEDRLCRSSSIFRIRRYTLPISSSAA